MKKAEAFVPLPDISGIGYIKEKPVKRLNLSTLIRRARFAESLLLEKRSTNDRMDMVAWNLTWRCLKRSRPALADLIQDPFFKEFMKKMVKVFDAEIRIKL